MATWLRQSTDAEIALGPFVDATDGVTPETALSVTQAEVRLKKNGGAWAQKNQASSATHEEEGWYEVSLDATDTNTLGVLVVAVYVAGALPVWREFLVVPANVYDAVLGSDKLQVDVAEWLGTAAQGASGRPEVDVELWLGAAPDALSSGKLPADVKLWLAAMPNALQGGRIDSYVGALADGVLTAAKFAAGAFDAVWSVAARTLTAFGFAVTVATNNDKTGYALTTAEKDDIVDRTWDEAIAPHLTNGTAGQKLNAAGALGGAGALQRTIGVTVGGNPLEGASVWLATDPAGANIVAGALVTNSQGIVTVLLDAGTYYVWVQKDGYQAIIGQQITVS